MFSYYSKLKKTSQVVTITDSTVQLVNEIIESNETKYKAYQF